MVHRPGERGDLTDLVAVEEAKPIRDVNGDAVEQVLFGNLQYVLDEPEV